MATSHLPPVFTAYLADLLQSGKFANVTRFRHAMILRWILWGDGHASNAFPGYETCPPADPRTAAPAGWTYKNFRSIALEVAASKRPAPQIDMARVVAAASAASTYRPVAKPLHHTRPAADTALRKPLTNLHKGCSGFGRPQFFQD